MPRRYQPIRQVSFLIAGVTSVAIVGPSARLLRLLSLLQTPRDWTGAELAERLEVSRGRSATTSSACAASATRSTRRAAPIGGYRLDAGAILPPLLLEDDEAVAVAVGLRTAAGGAVTGHRGDLAAGAGQARAGPAGAAAAPGQRAAGRDRARAPDRPGPTVDAEVLTLLAGDLPRPPTPAVRLRGPEAASTSQRTVGAAPARQLRAAAGTSSRGTRTGATGGRSASTGCGRTCRRERGSRPATCPTTEVAALVARGVPPAARRFQARVIVHAPAATIAERIGPWVGTVEAIDEERCILDTGADSLEIAGRPPGHARRGLHRHRAARARRPPALAGRALRARDGTLRLTGLVRVVCPG